MPMSEKLQFLFSAFFLMSFIALASAETFTSRAGYQYIVDTSFTTGMTAISGGNALANGNTVCIAPITITPTATSTYTNIQSANIECPTFPCAPLYSTAAIPQTAVPLAILWRSQASFDSIINNLCTAPPGGQGGAACTIFYAGAQAANPLAPNVVHSTYWQGLTSKAVHPANNGLFCKGSVQLSAGGSTVSTQSPDSLSAYVYTPSATGALALSTNLASTDCSIYGRSYETDGPTRDAIFFNSGGALVKSANSVMNFNIVQGVNLAGSGGGAAMVAAGDPFTITVTITNNGDLPATITGATLTSVPAAAFVVTGVTASPNPVAANGGTSTLTIDATAPGAAGVYALTAAVTYNPGGGAIGACGAAGQVQGGVTVGTAIVLPPGGVVPGGGGAGFGSLSINIKAIPASIVDSLIGTGAGQIQSTTLLTDITRGGNPIGFFNANITLYKYDPVTGVPSVLAYRDYDGAACSGGLRQVKYCSVSGTCAYNLAIASYSTSANITINQPLTYIPTQTSICPTDSPLQPAIYEARVEIYDPICVALPPGICQASQSRSTFFGIFSLTCEERA